VTDCFHKIRDDFNIRDVPEYLDVTAMNDHETGNIYTVKCKMCSANLP